MRTSNARASLASSSARVKLAKIFPTMTTFKALDIAGKTPVHVVDMGTHGTECTRDVLGLMFAIWMED